MPGTRISPRAKADLIEIWSYIAKDSETNADAFIDRLQEGSAGPPAGLGAPERGVGTGDSDLPFGRYIIFYRVVRKAVEIVRVLHGARDIPSIFEGGE